MGTSQDESSVSVHLTDCGRDAARAVFDVLEAAYPGHEPDLGSGGQPGRPVVWSMIVSTDAHRDGARPAGAPLGEAVDATLTGSPDGVTQVGGVLAGAFRAEETGRVPGEHECEVRVRLTGRE
ncbi:hypothetical protein [Streptomyces sp. RFCAC02]|uniref:hypothetical protein n=1 Tax=Streptomyces sp. RFCAC02 TaxID=2499143 RepID=UPI00101F980F|nr:hypothetical protein [Streptomyces sp. RFCAC02]